MKAVIDSDVLIDFLREQEKAKIFIEKINKEGNSVYVSVLTQAEILSEKDCNDNEKRKKTDDFLSSFDILDITQSLARKGGELRRMNGIPLHDAVIAATALELAATLYSRNLKHFNSIKELKVEKPY